MAAVVDLVGIKNAIKTILTTANTTTASPDLSATLSTRVNGILTVNPIMIMPQASLYPFVSCYISDKRISGQDIAASMSGAKRFADVMVDVMGAVWSNNCSDYTKDDGDDQINYLMENVEIVLRGATAETINGKVTFSIPDGCKYFQGILDESNSVKAGILTLKARVYY